MTARRQLAGLRAIVTGASSGVGRAVATELLARGSHVLATARRGDRLADLGGSFPSTGASSRYASVAGDITDPRFREHLVRVAIERLGGLDLVVTAAGSGAIGPLADMPGGTFQHVLDLDLVAPADLVRIALPHLAAGHDSAIVLIGSILGYHPLPLHAAYCAAKAGVVALAGSLRAELRPQGIDVLLASLGPTESEFWDALLTGERPAWSRGRPMSAATTARAIVTALERRHHEVIPGWRAKVFVWAARHAGWIIDAAIPRCFD
jgi:short-subunit dehydrogenase